ncbi:hypothetical protein ACELLULO517_21750 [Acidisoma cellulosilytica]|uniref:Uncharacterized protein n=1 Tax=Acidisoma cellulosilyticum TaxID=2802395 RepID=A0A964E5U5_9PROT|nr:hypothetical protein [Acidisoma cellulosilyticum]MCB8882886.1 hypothetical protein [Acidisoma cellulosilyticum]
MDDISGSGLASMKRRPKRRFRLRPPSPFVFMILSAALFLIGAASFNGHGSREMAEIGVGGAVLVIAVIAGFIL